MPQIKSLVFKNGAIYDGIVSSSRMLCHVDGDKLYEGTITSSSKALCTIRNGKIYQGTIVSSSRQLGLIDDAKAYKGTVKSSSKVVLSFTEQYTEAVLFLRAKPWAASKERNTWTRLIWQP